MYLAKMTTAQAKEAFLKDPIIVIPVGSTEQHGTQSALGTDFMVPSYLREASISDMKDCIWYSMVLWILLCSMEQNAL